MNCSNLRRFIDFISNSGTSLKKKFVLGNLFRNCKVKVEVVTDQNFVELKWQWQVDLKNNLT